MDRKLQESKIRLNGRSYQPTATLKQNQIFRLKVILVHATFLLLMAGKALTRETKGPLFLVSRPRE